MTDADESGLHAEPSSGEPEAAERVEAELPPLRLQRGGELGRGGMGVVTAAFDPVLERTVAVKHALARGAEGEQRLLREAKLTARLDHPAIVGVLDVGRDEEGRLAAVLPVRAGRSLGEAVAAGVPQQELLRALLVVAQAVAYAHARGVVHRDLSPGNVRLGEEGAVWVIDWGLAATLDEAQRGGFEGGTAGYVAPEQRARRPVGPTGDVWSLGALLHLVCTGRAPGDARTRPSDCPRPLWAITERALRASPDARYPDAHAFAAELARWLDGQPVEAWPEGWLARLARQARRWPRLTAGLGLALLVALVAATAAAVLIARAQQRARRATAALLVESAERALRQDDVATARQLAHEALEASESLRGRGVLAATARVAAVELTPLDDAGCEVLDELEGRRLCLRSGVVSVDGAGAGEAVPSGEQLGVVELRGAGTVDAGGAAEPSGGQLAVSRSVVDLRGAGSGSVDAGGAAKASGEQLGASRSVVELRRAGGAVEGSGEQLDVSRSVVDLRVAGSVDAGGAAEASGGQLAVSRSVVDLRGAGSGSVDADGAAKASGEQLDVSRSVVDLRGPGAGSVDTGGAVEATAAQRAVEAEEAVFLSGGRWLAVSRARSVVELRDAAGQLVASAPLSGGVPQVRVSSDRRVATVTVPEGLLVAREGLETLRPCTPGQALRFTIARADRLEVLCADEELVALELDGRERSRRRVLALSTVLRGAVTGDALDEDTLVVGSASGQLGVLSLSTLEVSRVAPSALGLLHTTVAARDGRSVVVVGERGLGVWRVPEGHLLPVAQGEAWPPDDVHLDDTGFVVRRGARRWRLTARERLSVASNLHGRSALAVHDGARLVAVGDAMGRVELLSLDTGAVASVTGVSRVIKSLAFSPSGRWLALGAAGPDGVLVFDTSGQQLRRVSGDWEGRPALRGRHVVFLGEDLLLVYSWGPGPWAARWSPEREAFVEISLPAVPGDVRGVVSDGEHVFSLDVSGRWTSLVPGPAGQVIREEARWAPVPSVVAGSPDGRLFITATERTVERRASGQRFEVAAPVESLALASDGRLGVCRRDGVVELRDARDIELLEVRAFEGRCGRVAFCDGERALCAVGWDGFLRVIEAPSRD